MRNPTLSRRRMIAITATALGSAFVSGSRIARAQEAVRWHGSALGAQVSMEIYHPDRAEAERLVGSCLLDIRRLEQQFSLYRQDSAICTLNRTGILVAPDPDMVALLEASLAFGDLTGGAFDPTVQPLWSLYADHFSSERPDPNGPPREKLAEVLTRVGRRGLLVTPDRIALAHRGAAITLNGIAQGFATDKVVEKRRKAGLSTTLVNMGEIRAIGPRPEGGRGVSVDPDRPGALTETIELVDRAVATTAGAGFRFDATGRFTHIFDPTTGLSPSLYRTVSVVAPSATEADALSTAFSLMAIPRIRDSSPPGRMCRRA
ncbi:FAD:protein FMN transferase [Bradyrhizobium sp. AS23.2]|uniref:FAD:protein FMN transferase n=1 Tax=Bradyrhizobium sp. AS23.2 TaxID=1680155 RepID=UPI000A4303DA